MDTNPKPERTEFRVVIFRRKEGWFPLRLPVGDDLSAIAAANPGTESIEDAKTGAVLWPRLS